MYKKALILMVVVEAVSLLSFVIDGASLPLLIITGLVVFVLSLKNLEWGVYILFAELFFGSRGHLLEFDYGPVSISLRLVIFAAVFLAWIVSAARSSNFGVRIQNTKYKILYTALLVVLGYGIIIGILNGNSIANVFNDANGYLYLLILPAVFSAITSKEHVVRILQILGAAIVVVALKTLILFIWFAGDFVGVATLYHWVIERDIGEITGIVGSASRIFMQSQFYALIGAFVFGVLYFGKFDSFFSKRVTWLVLAASYLSIILSLSRSFWLGAIAGSIFASLAVLFILKVSFARLFKFGLIVLFIIALELGGLYLITVSTGGGISGSVISRIENPVNEAAGSARLLLLPKLLTGIREAPIFGKGFGSELSYKSFLPDKVAENNPDGEITAFTFEWGYLDMILKFGILGFLVYLFWIASIFKSGWHRSHPVALGLLAGLVALVVLNVTTPYLNHPLGIGYLIFLSVEFLKDG